MTVSIYLDTGKDNADEYHLKVFATSAAATRNSPYSFDLAAPERLF
jgi:hypothetical protein